MWPGGHTKACLLISPAGLSRDLRREVDLTANEVESRSRLPSLAACRRASPRARSIGQLIPARVSVRLLRRHRPRVPLHRRPSSSATSARSRAPCSTASTCTLKSPPWPTRNCAAGQRPYLGPHPRPRRGRAPRLQDQRGFYNSTFPSKPSATSAALDDAGERTLEMAVRRMGLSARAHDRILKVARTIADLAERRSQARRRSRAASEPRPQLLELKMPMKVHELLRLLKVNDWSIARQKRGATASSSMSTRPEPHHGNRGGRSRASPRHTRRYAQEGRSQMTKRYSIVIEPGPDGCSAYSPDVPRSGDRGQNGRGASGPMARRSRFTLRDCAVAGRPLPEPTSTLLITRHVAA